jgi:hypothetical protein
VEKVTLVSPHKVRRDAIKHGYRSGLEHKLSTYLKENKCKFSYESIKIEWEDLCYRTYTPDFILYNGIIIETKGSKRKLSKGAKSTYAEWCIRYGFRYYDRIIPEDWLKEKGKNKHPKFIRFSTTKIRR